MKKPVVPPKPQAAVRVLGAQQKGVGQHGWSPRGLGLQAPRKGTSTRAPSIRILNPSLGSTPRRSSLVITSSVLVEHPAPGTSVLTTLPSRDVQRS